jgi:spore germination cell wall hydrolase CwlJ-like protein
MKNPKPWSSASKWFVPFHIGIMLLIFVFMMLFPMKANAYDENGDRYCLAQNIYFEAANQPDAGRMAVAHVVLNRVEDGQFPNTVCDVVYQAKWGKNWKGNDYPIRNKCQFSWFCDGKSDEPTDSVTWMESIKLAGWILDGSYPDITEGALWYHAKTVDPYWNDFLEETVIINDHIFYK